MNENFSNIFTARNCKIDSDRPAYRKAGNDYFTEKVNTDAKIESFSAKKAFYERLGIAAIAIVLAIVVIAIVATFTPYRFLGIYRNSYVPEDVGKVVEIDPYWEELNVRSETGKVIGTVEGGLKETLSGNYKALGIRKCAQTIDGRWIAMEGIHGREYILERAVALWMVVFLSSFFLLWFPSNKATYYEEEIQEEIQHFLSLERVYAERAEWNAIEAEIASYNAPIPPFIPSP